LVKREQLRFIIENKDKIAAIYALYQRLPNEKFLFSNRDDIIYFRTVADAIEESYPESPFLPTLRTDIARMEAHKALVSQIKESGYPDFELPDMYGENIRLSSLAGKVVLLSFWSAQSGRMNRINADMKDIYERFAERGFEIYQVGIDTSKALWINIVQEQKLPWISVVETRGENSPVLGMYNIKSLPANFLIDSDGNIVAKNIYGKDLELQLEKLTL
jgi:peroxiredoxin